MRKCALGEVEMAASQIRAAELLLKKALPDLSHHSGEMTVSNSPIRHLIESVEAGQIIDHERDTHTDRSG